MWSFVWVESRQYPSKRQNQSNDILIQFLPKNINYNNIHQEPPQKFHALHRVLQSYFYYAIYGSHKIKTANVYRKISNLQTVVSLDFKDSKRIVQ